MEDGGEVKRTDRVKRSPSRTQKPDPTASCKRAQTHTKDVLVKLYEKRDSRGQYRPGNRVNADLPESEAPVGRWI